MRDRVQWCVLVGVLLASTSARASKPSSSMQAALSGHWITSEDATAIDARVQAAVEATAAQFPWIVRGLVRSKLAEGAVWCPDVTLALTATRYTVQCAGQSVVTRLLDNSEGPFTVGDGRTVDTEIAVVGEQTLSVRFLGDKGSRDVLYTGVADSLRMTISIVSPHLSEPLQWTVDYRRAEEKND